MRDRIVFDSAKLCGINSAHVYTFLNIIDDN